MKVFDPLKYQPYRTLWVVALFSNTGTWMHNTAAAAALAGLNPSPLVNSLFYAAMTLPVFLVALPAGVMGDVWKRGFLLFWANALSAVTALSFAFLDFTHYLSAIWIVTLTFLMNTLWAFMYPAWNTEISTSLPSEQIKTGASLNNLSFNAARTIGPAIGGALFNFLGGGPVYLINALSFVGFVGVFLADLTSFRPVRRAHWKVLFSEVRTTLGDFPFFRSLLFRSGVYFFFAQLIWTFLPVHVTQNLGWSAGSLGLLTGGIGIGAIASALGHPCLRRQMSDERILFYATLGTVFSLFVFACSANFSVLFLGLIFFGAGFALSISTNNALIQVHIPLSVRSRAVALYLVVLYGTQALGAVIVGFAANLWNIPRVTTVVATLLLISVTGYRWQTVTAPENSSENLNLRG